MQLDQIEDITSQENPPLQVGVPHCPAKDSRQRTLERLNTLWHKRAFLMHVAVAGLLAGTLLAFLLPKKFESTTQLMPPDSQSSSTMSLLAGLAGRNSSGLGAFAGDLLGFKSSGALFVGILRSRTVQDHLIDRFHLQNVYGVRLQEDASRILEENTAVSEDRKSGIITLTVTDHDPQRAAALARAYVEELDHLVVHVSTSSAGREREFLEDRLGSVQNDLEASEKDLSQFSSKNGTVDLKEQGKAMVEAAATVEGQLIAAKSELEGLRRIYADDSVRVKSARARINELQAEMQKMGGSDQDDGTGSLYPPLRKLPLLGVTYSDLYRRVKLEEAVYEALTQQFELAKVEEAKETPSVKVLDAPNIPSRKSFPPRLLIIFLCTFLCFSGAAFVVLIRDSWQVLDPNDPGKSLLLEVFATLTSRVSRKPMIRRATETHGSAPRNGNGLKQEEARR